MKLCKETLLRFHDHTYYQIGYRTHKRYIEHNILEKKASKTFN